MGYILEITSGLYYKTITIVNDDSRFINKLETSLNDDARVVIYDRHMFIVQATVFSDFVIIEGAGVKVYKFLTQVLYN